MPSIVIIRPATAADATAIAEIHVRAWRAAYAGMMPDAYLADLSVEKRTAFWERELMGKKSTTLVAMNEGIIVGWVSGGQSRDEDSCTEFEVYAIYVSPESWGTGIGRCLMDEISRNFPSGSPTTVWVLENNRQGCGFYRHLGFEADGTSKILQIGGMSLTEIRMRKECNPMLPQSE